MSNPETRLVWHPLQDSLTKLRQECLRNEETPPHWERIESIVGEGIPDLTWSWRGVEGWLELKHRHDVPVGEHTPVVISSVTPHQRLWWRQRHESGGRVFVLTRVASTYYLHQGNWAAFNLGSVNLESLVSHASLVLGRNEFNAAAILQEMMK